MTHASVHEIIIGLGNELLVPINHYMNQRWLIVNSNILNEVCIKMQDFHLHWTNLFETIIVYKLLPILFRSQVLYKNTFYHQNSVPQGLLSALPWMCSSIAYLPWPPVCGRLAIMSILSFVNTEPGTHLTKGLGAHNWNILKILFNITFILII